MYKSLIIVLYEGEKIKKIEIPCCMIRARKEYRYKSFVILDL